MTRGVAGVKPVGHPTRGTTGTNRLRRMDRWLAEHPVFRGADAPLVVDLGFGASGTTVFELADRLAARVPGVRVHGVEIDAERVARAQAQLDRAPRADVSFGRGGFEVPTPAGDAPLVIRAANVLRQYDESEVATAWAALQQRLAPGGLIIDGTCDEIGRVSSWLALDQDGPRTFTISLRLADLHSPAIVAERLPKALIHHNVPGERIHTLISDLEDAWQREAPRAVFGPKQRFEAAALRMRDAGWELATERRRLRRGEITVPYAQLSR